MRRHFRLPQPFIPSVIFALVILGLSSPLAAETDFVINPGRAAFPMVITLGPDHNLWFTENSGLKIGTINTHGVITEYPIPGAQALLGITTGPDGNLWFTDEFRLHRPHQYRWRLPGYLRSPSRQPSARHRGWTRWQAVVR